MSKSIQVICFFLVCLLADASGQSLTVNTQQLNFGNVFENSPDSMPVIISNNTGRDVTVTNIRFYNTYGQPAFSSSWTWFMINDNSSATVWIKFSPRHNILHNSEMVIENDGRGNVSVDLRGQGKYSRNYYNLTENLSEENLKTILGVVTGNGYVQLGYNIARDSMFMNIDNEKVNGQGSSQNRLECVYTGREAVGYTDRTDCQTNHSFNTEHTFPQSFFNSQEPMRSDLNHIFPTDDGANNQRADDPFGEVTNPSWSNGGSFSNGSTFEPRDLQKGVVARSLFYFVLRYQDYNNFVQPQESVLRTWYWNYLPSTIDSARNEGVFSAQHNRNPFIDYPVFLERIQSITTNSVAPIVSSVDVPEDTIIFGTIPTATQVTHNFVIVNTGNTGINLSNFSLSNPALSFAGNVHDTTLAPGDGFNIGIYCTTSSTDSIHAFLTFQTTAPSNLNVSVPVFVNDSLYNSVPESQNSFSVYPNPATGMVFINSVQHQIEWKLFNSGGVMLASGSGKEINTHSFAPGIYYVKINSGKDLFARRITITR